MIFSQIQRRNIRVFCDHCMCLLFNSILFHFFSKTTSLDSLPAHFAGLACKLDIRAVTKSILNRSCFFFYMPTKTYCTWCQRQRSKSSNKRKSQVYFECDTPGNNVPDLKMSVINPLACQLCFLLAASAPVKQRRLQELMYRWRKQASCNI